MTRTCLVLLVTLVLCGCSGPTVCLDAVGLAAGVPIQREIVGKSVEGRPLECIALGAGGDVTFVLAAIHGDEPAGVGLVCRLAGHLQRQQSLLSGRGVVLLPVANPDGFARSDRYNTHGVDLNRNFPADNRTDDESNGPTPLSEPEARAIEWLIRLYAPRRIVSIHQLTDVGPEALSATIPRGCIDHDGPAQDIAEHMSKYCDLPVKKLGARPGSLGSYAGVTIGIPTITLELPLHAHHLYDELLWQRYGRALLAAVVYPERVE